MLNGEVTEELPARTRVLWLIKGLGPGGAEHLLVSSAEVVDTLRFHYSVAYVRPDKAHLAAALAARGVPSACLASGAGGGRLWPLRLRSLLRHVDVVHAHSPLLAGVARLLVRTVPASARPRIVTTEHNVWQSFSAPTRWLNRLTSGMDSHRFAVSQEVKRSMTARAARSTDVLIHGINHASPRKGSATRESVRASLGVPSDAVVAITVANFRAEKDYPNLLRAADIARCSDPRLRVLAVGQGPLEADIRDLHAKLELGETFTLLGFREDVPDVLGAADLFVLGSLHEGLPVAIMEAMAAGLPIVSTAVGGVGEAVTDGENGILVPAADPQALAAAILRVAGDDELRAKLSLEAKKRSSDFDISTTVLAEEVVYARLGARV